MSVVNRSDAEVAGPAPGGMDPLDMLAAIEGFCLEDRPFALVTLLETEGSAPAEVGSQAIVEASGAIRGTVGGGALEARARERAVEAIALRRVHVFEFGLQGDDTSKPVPICGGRVRVLVDARAAKHREAFVCARRVRDQGGGGLLLTTVPGAAASPRADATVEIRVEWVDEAALKDRTGHPSPGELVEVLRREESRYFRVATSPDVGVLATAVVPKPQLLIVGGGHVGQALARQARLVGFEITVIEDREEFGRPALFPDGTMIGRGSIREQIERFPFTKNTFIALMTRGHQHDAEALELCLRRPHAYLGMIGSRRKVTMMRAAFIESGRATADEWARVHAPIGLDVGAVTVPEIAVSIVAELVAARRHGHPLKSCQPLSTPAAD